jgi:hypothetical protein
MLLVALVSRFAEALIQSEREKQARLHAQLEHAHAKITNYGAGAAQPASDRPSIAEKEHLPWVVASAQRGRQSSRSQNSQPC